MNRVAVGGCVLAAAVAVWPVLAWIEHETGVRHERPADRELVDDYLDTLHAYPHPIYTFSGNVELPRIAFDQTSVRLDSDPRTSLVTAPSGTFPSCADGAQKIHAVPVPSGTDPDDFLDVVTTTCLQLDGGAVLAEEATAYADGRATSNRYTVLVSEPEDVDVEIRVGPAQVSDARPADAAEDLLDQVVVLDPSGVSRGDVVAGYLHASH